MSGARARGAAALHTRRAGHNSRRAAGARAGLSLYEVIVSLAIFLPALAVLAQAITNGGRAAIQAQLQTEAVLRCDTLIAEVVAGIQPLQSVGNSPFMDDQPEWSWSLQVMEGPYPGLLEIHATVMHVDLNGRTNASVTLNRLMRDPQLAVDGGIVQLGF